jgi:hypothetical protein
LHLLLEQDSNSAVQLSQKLVGLSLATYRIMHTKGLATTRRCVLIGSYVPTAMLWEQEKQFPRFRCALGISTVVLGLFTRRSGKRRPPRPPLHPRQPTSQSYQGADNLSVSRGPPSSQIAVLLRIQSRYSLDLENVAAYRSADTLFGQAAREYKLRGKCKGQ